MSALIHGLVLAVLLVASRLPGCQGTLDGEGDDLRQVGIYVRPAESSPSQNESETESPSDLPTSSDLHSLRTAAEPVPDTPPVELSLPSLDAPPLIGLGQAPRSATSISDLLQPTRVGEGTPPAGESGPAMTSMFGISDVGNRLVYVIDNSSSMANYGAMQVAKAQLMSSLERLNDSQQFQVLFVNSGGVRPLNPGRFDMFFGTDSQRLEVRLQVANVSADQGTDHRGGLLAALGYNPDVVFYLTDAGEPYLLKPDLEEIRRKNRGSRIHTIHFGEGPPPRTGAGGPATNFLQTLSSQNNGRYTYKNVKEFIRR